MPATSERLPWIVKRICVSAMGTTGQSQIAMSLVYGPLPLDDRARGLRHCSLRSGLLASRDARSACQLDVRWMSTGKAYSRYKAVAYTPVIDCSRSVVSAGRGPGRQWMHHERNKRCQQPHQQHRDASILLH